jgi:hypothetical protein
VDIIEKHWNQIRELIFAWFQILQDQQQDQNKFDFPESDNLLGGHISLMKGRKRKVGYGPPWMYSN